MFAKSRSLFRKTFDITVDFTVDVSLLTHRDMTFDFTAVHPKLVASHIPFDVAGFPNASHSRCRDMTHHLSGNHQITFNIDASADNCIFGNDTYAFLHNTLRFQLPLILFRHQDFRFFIEPGSVLANAQCFHHLIPNALLMFLSCDSLNRFRLSL